MPLVAAFPLMVMLAYGSSRVAVTFRFITKSGTVSVYCIVSTEKAGSSVPSLTANPLRSALLSTPRRIWPIHPTATNRLLPYAISFKNVTPSFHPPEDHVTPSSHFIARTDSMDVESSITQSIRSEEHTSEL